MMILKKSRRNSIDSIYCRMCRNPVARVQDYISRVRRAGVFSRVYNVVVSNDHENFHFGSIIADTYCGQCRMLIGWEYIQVPLWFVVRDGRFVLFLSGLCYWDGVPLLHLNEEQDLGANEENADQDGDAHEQNDANEQDVGVNEENTDQDGDATDQDGDATDQDGDATDEDGDSTDEDGDSTDEDGDSTDEDGDSTDEDGDATDQDGDVTDQDGDSTNQDVGVNEENADQDGDSTDQDGDSTDEDGDATDQDGDATDQDGDVTDQDGDSTDQDVGVNEENADQDGGTPMN
ncbi:uncharacterized protein DDB_G0290685-like [Solanum pennellii]|uniref:Uncharacterized protein DDB_G0290685-like n=1 Tax=Solanum pennellii TaxID=28526 RepID=A0ABM1GMB7_SOLPN|nr:uncharacterized protein DDB_G0290685-like [Solanum pennellii]